MVQGNRPGCGVYPITHRVSEHSKGNVSVLSIASSFRQLDIGVSCDVGPLDEREVASHQYRGHRITNGIFDVRLAKNGTEGNASSVPYRLGRIWRQSRNG